MMEVGKLRTFNFKTNMHRRIIFTNFTVILLLVLLPLSLARETSSGSLSAGSSAGTSGNNYSSFTNGGGAGVGEVGGQDGLTQTSTVAAQDHGRVTGDYQGPKCRDRTGWLEPGLFKLSTCGSCFAYLYFVPEIQLNPMDMLLVVHNASFHPVQTYPPDIHNQTVVVSVCTRLEEAKQDCGRWKDCCQAAEDCCKWQLDKQKQQQTSATSYPPDGRPSRSSLAYSFGSSATNSSASSGTSHYYSTGSVSTSPGSNSSAGDDSVSEDSSVHGDTGVSLDYCPATWDGYSCWDNTKAGTTAKQHCAAYIDEADPDMELKW